MTTVKTLNYSFYVLLKVNSCQDKYYLQKNVKVGLVSKNWMKIVNFTKAGVRGG
jgi:hypothetical protein